MFSGQMKCNHAYPCIVLYSTYSTYTHKNQNVNQKVVPITKKPITKNTHLSLTYLLRTRYQLNFGYFSIQFLPHSGDRILITGAADTKVHVHDLTVKETIHMFSDHTNRVKRIATAPMWPNTFWSAAEDGIIR